MPAPAPDPAIAAPATWSLASAPGTSALAVIEVTGDVDAALAACGIKPVAVGEVGLRDFFGLDAGVVARYSVAHAHLMPHGGPAVVRGMLDGLTRAGIAPSHDPQYPEARSTNEASALAALARAASPIAVDAVLSRMDTWNDAAEHDLRFLLHPALVVAIGRPNIGKSSLVNALAKRSVSIVADEPGTTRDHVGVRLDLAGLVVHYVDTPGLRDTEKGATDDPIETRATSIALDLAARADLLLICSDAANPPPRLPPSVSPPHTLHVGLRADLGASRHAPRSVCAITGVGMEQLVRDIRSCLIPGVLAAP
ncbi:MAG TPA: GTPase [Phycisphaerales bacterium]|nr:GTPase [Phycisphaerales bacterium]